MPHHVEHPVGGDVVGDDHREVLTQLREGRHVGVRHDGRRRGRDGLADVDRQERGGRVDLPGREHGRVHLAEHAEHDVAGDDLAGAAGMQIGPLRLHRAPVHLQRAEHRATSAGRRRRPRRAAVAPALLAGPADQEAQRGARRRAATRGAGPLADEHHALGALLVGRAREEGWRDGGAPPADVYAARALVAAVLCALKVDWRAVQAQRPYLHPGRAGEIVAGDVVLGVFGEVHPTVLATWEIDAPAAFLAIDVGKAVAAAPDVVTYADMTTFPELRQDLAVIVADDVTADRVLDVVRAAGAPLIAEAARLRRLPRRAGGGGPRVARAAPRVPRGGPHAHRRGRRAAARADRRRAAGRDRAVSCVAEPRILVAGASGFAGAIAARLIDRHPHFELGPVTVALGRGAHARRAVSRTTG